jgi:cation-transporting P-type ATPase C
MILAGISGSSVADASSVGAILIPEMNDRGYPPAFSAAINSAVKQGILIKGGAYIEQMSEANTVLLDKTGTITEGRPKVVSAQVLVGDMDEKEMLALAMASEETSSHPLAGAILAYGAEQGVKIPAHGEVVTEVSRGSRTEV